MLKPTGFARNLVKQAVALLRISVPAKLNTISSGIPRMKNFWGLFPLVRREKANQKRNRPVFSFWKLGKLQWFQEGHCNLCQLRICWRLLSSGRSKIYLMRFYFIDFIKHNLFCYFWLCICMALGKWLSLHVLSLPIYKIPVILISHVILSPLKRAFADICRALETFGCTVLWQHSQSPTAPLCGSGCGSGGERRLWQSIPHGRRPHRGVPGSQHQCAQEFQLRLVLGGQLTHHRFKWDVRPEEKGTPLLRNTNGCKKHQVFIYFHIVLQWRWR